MKCASCGLSWPALSFLPEHSCIERRERDPFGNWSEEERADAMRVAKAVGAIVRAEKHTSLAFFATLGFSVGGLLGAGFSAEQIRAGVDQTLEQLASIRGRVAPGGDG